MKLLFIGDIMLGRLVNEKLKSAPPGYPWSNTLPIFQQADVRFCNLECVISDWGQPWSATEKVFHFRSDSKNVAVLKAANINCVSLANNHILDFEYEAMSDTLKFLDTTGIHHAGAGMNFSEATQPTIFSVNIAKLGLLAFTDNEPDWKASENKPGVFYVPIDLNNVRAKKLMELVNQTKRAVDLLIVSAHWGPNWGYRPPPHHIPFAHALIDAGTDIIFGHSCHVFQGIEIYHGKPILYSTGDFIDDYAVDEIERNNESFIFVAETEGKRIIRLTLYPTKINNFQAMLALPRHAAAIAAKMHRMCSQFDTATQWNKVSASVEIVLPK